MKSTIRLIILAGMLLSSLPMFSQSTNVRGFYLNDIDSWIGNTTTENAVLNYASGNGYNYIVFYSLGSFDFNSTTKKNQLADFIRRAKTTYGISKVAASGEILSFFRDLIIPYNNSRSSSSEKFDIFNYEFEWWVSSSVSTLYCSKYLAPNGYSCDTAGAWRYSWNQFQQIDALAAANGLTTEYYLGWPTKGRMQAVAGTSDRILLHAYRTTDSDVYAYSRNRLIDAASIARSVTIIPIFSSESSFMGPWLNSNPITKPYQTYSSHYTAETSSFKQYINLQGYQWYNYNHLPKTTIATASISASGPTTFCTGGSVTLTANSGSAYLWSNGSTSRSITVSSSGSFTVRVTNSSGASAVSSPIAVSVTTSIARPTISASGPVSFCPGGTVTLTSSSAPAYLWSNGATSRSITVSSSGNYSVTITSGNCSSTSTATAVNVTNTPPPPTVTTSGSTNICPGTAVTLTSSSSNGYLWSNGATTRSIVVSSGGTYWVRGYGGPNCFSQSTNINTTLLTAPAIPTITSSGSLTLTSSNPSVTLTSSSANAYSWNNGSASRSITVNTQGNYRVTVTGSNGCKSTSKDLFVTANGCTPPPAPTITFSGSNIISSGQTVTLTSSTAGGYLWSTGATTRSITVNAAGTYSVRAYSGGGCFSSSLPVTVYVVAARLQKDDPKNIITAYPNPAIDHLRLQFDSETDINSNVRISDLSGRVVYELNFPATTGENVLDIDVASIPRGVYFAYITDERQQRSVRIVLQ